MRRVSSLELGILDNNIYFQGGFFMLESLLTTQLTALLTTKTQKLEMYYQLRLSSNTALNIQLMNGLLIEAANSGDQTVRITLTYIPEENLLHNYPIEHIGPLHPIIDEGNGYVLNFFQNYTGSVLRVVTCYVVNVDQIIQLEGEGSIAGPIGTILIFAQKKSGIYLEKIRP